MRAGGVRLAPPLAAALKAVGSSRPPYFEIANMADQELTNVYDDLEAVYGAGGSRWHQIIPSQAAHRPPPLPADAEQARERYQKIRDAFVAKFGAEPEIYARSPGERTSSAHDPSARALTPSPLPPQAA